jgi:hypothetical protein
MELSKEQASRCVKKQISIDRVVEIYIELEKKYPDPVQYFYEAPNWQEASAAHERDRIKNVMDAAIKIAIGEVFGSLEQE